MKRSRGPNDSKMTTVRNVPSCCIAAKLIIIKAHHRLRLRCVLHMRMFTFSGSIKNILFIMQVKEVVEVERDYCTFSLCVYCDVIMLGERTHWRAHLLYFY